MARILILAMFLALSTMSAGSFAAAAEEAPPELSCECRASSCGPCEIETGVKVYAAKCGANQSRMKSCKKPSCEPVPEQEQCLAALGVPTGDRKPASPSLRAENPAASDLEKVKAPSAAARVVALEGRVTIRHAGASGASDAARLAMELSQGDTIETGDRARAKLAFLDGSGKRIENDSVVGPLTRLTIQEHVSEGASRRTVLFLHQGGVRSKVGVAYDGKKSDGAVANEYLVRTRAAVAGVRGTDFLTTFDPEEKDWHVNVRTFEGRVRLSRAQASSASDRSWVDVNAGNESRLTAEGAGIAGIPADRLSAALASASLRAPWKVQGDELARAASDWSMTEPVARRSGAGNPSVRHPSSAAVTVCSSPAADYGQCSWVCEGARAKNLAGCPTHEEGVQCMQRTCLANGQWSKPLPLPKSEGDRCGGGAPVVRACDSY